jgi:carbon storage regulator
MLVLSRKLGEQVVLPGIGVMLTVVSIQGGRVRLSRSAPPEVGVWREEVWREEQAEPPPGSVGSSG